MAALIYTLPTYPTTAQTLASMQTAIQGLNPLITNFNPGGVAETILEAFALGLGSDANEYPGVAQEGAYQLLAFLQTTEFILTASGTYLDLKAADVGVERKQPSTAGGSYVFYTTVEIASAVIVPTGTVVAIDSIDPTQPPVLYTTQANATIPAGPANTQAPAVQILCEQTGAVGNAQPGTILTVVGGPANVGGSNPYQIGGGADLEGDDTPNGGLRARALAAIPNASQGTLEALEFAARSYAGIVDANAVDIVVDPSIPLANVTLYVDDGTGNLGSGSDPNNPVIAELQAALNGAPNVPGLYRAGGIRVTVVGSTLAEITIGLTCYLNSYYATVESSVNALSNAILLAVYNYVGASTIGQPILIADVIRYALGVPGVSNVPAGNVTINGVASDYITSSTQTARLPNLSAISLLTQLVDY